MPFALIKLLRRFVSIHQLNQSGLVNFNTGDFLQVNIIIFVSFFLSAFAFLAEIVVKVRFLTVASYSADWSSILVNGCFIRILVSTVICFVSHHVLLFQQIKIGF